MLGKSLRASAITGFATVVPGMLLLLQDMAIAKIFGASQKVDAYQIALIVPLQMINVLAGGALQGSLVPVLVRARLCGEQELRTMVARAIQQVTMFLVVASLLIGCLFPYVLPRVAKGFSGETLGLAGNLFWIVLPVLLFGGLASLLAAALNSIHRFATAALLPALAPLIALIGTILLAPRFGIQVVAVSVLIGSIVQAFVAFELARGTGIVNRHRAPYPDGEAKPLTSQYAYAALGTGLMTGMLLVSYWVATTLPPGSVAIYGFASRPVLLAVALITITVGNATLPFFSHQVVLGDWTAIHRLMWMWAAILITLATPIVVAWFLFSENIVHVVFERGEFTASAAALTAVTQRIFVLQIPFYLLGMLFTRISNALGENQRQLMASFMGFLINLLLAPFCAARWGLPGVAAAATTSYAVWAGVLGFGVMTSLGKRRKASGNQING